jgi:hypothetical protein
MYWAKPLLDMVTPAGHVVIAAAAAGVVSPSAEEALDKLMKQQRRLDAVYMADSRQFPPTAAAASKAAVAATSG